ncbi:MAG: alpha/beta hydrolase-fold protein, partial [Bacteroidota bacterium]
MKTIHLLMVLAFVSLQLTPCSAQTNESDNATTNQISIGVRDGLYSEILKEQRELLIHVPSSAGYGRRFPVLFVLDGEYHFESVVGIMKYHSLSGLIPEMIVVAIPNTDRFRDLTTSHIGDDTNPSGGAGNFTKFLESELIPYIDKTYPTFPHRTLFGHSLGGLVVVNTLLNHKHLFNNYLAIDPSLSWGDQSFLKEAKSKIQERVYEDKSLYIAIANTLRGGMTVEEARQDTTTATLHLRSIFEFSELAKANEQLLSDSKYYGSETHGTLPIIAEQDAFRFLFSWYQFEHWGEFYSPAPKFSGEELRDMVVSY